MFRNWLLKLGIVIFVFVSCFSTVFAELPTASQVASKMKVGWNMGNALECPLGETGWGSAFTTQALIDSVKAAGFNTVRLPVAWFCHSDTITNVIDPAWMARVKTVVDYCIKDSMYVIINIHWDKGWLENRINVANQAVVNRRQRNYWTQIANRFKDYDEHLLFAGANEPNAPDSAKMVVLMSYYQTFVDAVRATGGNNRSRTLIVQGPETNIEKTNSFMNDLPCDPIKNRMMVEVHYYTPYQFCLMEKDADWGKMFFYWGMGNHSKADTIRNAKHSEEQEVDRQFMLMKTKFVDKGVPVILGEFAAARRRLTPPSNQKLHDASVDSFYEYVVKAALRNGIIPYCWDVNHQMFDRKSGKIRDRRTLNAIMRGAK